MTAFEFGIKINALDNASKVISGIQEKVGGFQDRMAKFGLATQGVQAVASSLSAVTNAFKGYEADLAAVSAVTGQSGEALENIGSAARGLAKDFGGSASDQLKSFQGILSKFGADQFKSAEGAKALEAVSRNINILSAASGDSAAMSMDTLTDAMLQMGVNTADADVAAKTSAEYINALAASAQVGSAEIPQVGAAILQVGAVAKGANMNFAGLNAAIQVLAAGGKKGSEAGVALRNVINLMINTSGEGELAMAKLGTSSAELGKVLTDPAKGLNEAMKIVKRGLGGVASDAERLAIMGKIFGSENAAAATQLANNTELYEQYNNGILEGVKSGAAFEQANIRMNTASAISARAIAQFNDLLIAGGKAIGSYGVAAIDSFNSIVPTLSGLAGLKMIIPPGAFSAIGSGASTAFGALRTSAGAALGSVQTSFAALRGSLSGLSLSGMATSVTDGVRGMSASIFSGVRSLQTLAFEKIRVIAASNLFSGGIAGFARTIGGSLLQGIRSAISGIWGLNRAFLTSPVVWIGAAIAGAAYLIYSNWDKIGAFFEGMFSGIGAAFSSAWSILEEVKAAFQPIIDAVWKLFQPVESTGQAVAGVANNFGWLKDAGIVAGQYIGTAFRVIVTPILWVTKVIGQTIGLLTGVTQSGGNMARVLVGAFTAITAPAQAVFGLFRAVFQFIQDLFSGASLAEAGQKLVMSLLEGIKAGWQKITDGVMGIVNGVKNLFSGKSESGTAQAQKVAAPQVEKPKVPEPEAVKPPEIPAPKVGTPKVPKPQTPKLMPLNPPETPDFSWIEKQNIKPPKFEPMLPPEIKGTERRVESRTISTAGTSIESPNVFGAIKTGVKLPNLDGIKLPNLYDIVASLPNVSGLPDVTGLLKLPKMPDIGGIPKNLQELLKKAGVSLPSIGVGDVVPKLPSVKDVPGIVAKQKGGDDGVTVNFTVNLSGEAAASGGDGLRGQIMDVMRDATPELVRQIERALNQNKRKAFDTI